MDILVGNLRKKTRALIRSKIFVRKKVFLGDLLVLASTMYATVSMMTLPFGKFPLLLTSYAPFLS